MVIRRSDMRPSVSLHIPMDPRLKDLIGKAADDEGLPMNEWAARVLAEALEHPELAPIPRKPMGRPRKELAAAR